MSDLIVGGLSITGEGWKQLCKSIAMHGMSVDIRSWMNTYVSFHMNGSHRCILWNKVDINDTYYREMAYSLGNIHSNEYKYCEYIIGTNTNGSFGSLSYEDDPFHMRYYAGMISITFSKNAVQLHTDLFTADEAKKILNTSSNELVKNYQCPLPGCGEMLDSNQEKKCWKCETPIRM